MRIWCLCIELHILQKKIWAVRNELTALYYIFSHAQQKQRSAQKPQYY
jgi:hypothetical protein